MLLVGRQTEVWGVEHLEIETQLLCAPEAGPARSQDGGIAVAEHPSDETENTPAGLRDILGTRRPGRRQQQRHSHEDQEKESANRLHNQGS